jgi:hypothetical protein
LPGGTEENQSKTLVEIANLQAQTWTWDLPNTKVVTSSAYPNYNLFTTVVEAQETNV